MGSKKVTVADLIRELKKCPKNARVVWKDHDHSAEEYNAQVKYVHSCCDELCEELGEEPGSVIALSG